MLRGVQTDVVEEIIWKKMLVVNWIFKPYHLLKEIENEKMRTKFAGEQSTSAVDLLDILDVPLFVFFLLPHVLTPLFNFATGFLKFLFSVIRRFGSDVRQSLSQR